MWWKQNKWKVIIPVAIVALLAFTFMLGGDLDGPRGQVPGPEAGVESVMPEAPTAAPSGAPEPSLAPAPSASAPEEMASPSPEPSAEPSAQPSESPSEEPSPELSQEPHEEPSEEPSEEPAPDPSPESSMEIDPETGKDQYGTDPVPEGRPAPVEPENVTVGDAAYTCTISISCATILDNMDRCDPEKVELVPEDGWVLEPVEVTFYEGESVFNVLQRVCRQQSIHMEFSMTPIYNSAYIEGIGNLYEFDCGELSGWMYEVNDWFPNYGCSRYQLQDGDVIQWRYTCDLGDDVGGGYAAGKQT